MFGQMTFQAILYQILLRRFWKLVMLRWNNNNSSRTPEASPGPRHRSWCKLRPRRLGLVQGHRKNLWRPVSRRLSGHQWLERRCGYLLQFLKTNWRLLTPESVLASICLSPSALKYYIQKNSVKYCWSISWFLLTLWCRVVVKSCLNLKVFFGLFANLRTRPVTILFQKHFRALEQ